MPCDKPCAICKRKFNKLYTCREGKELRCKQCQLNNSHTHTQISSSEQREPLKIFTHTDADSNRMTAEQRRGIVILHQDNNSIEQICMKVGCSKPTAHHWINHYRITGNFNDDVREGRKRKLDELTVDEIVDISKQDHFKTPKGTQKTTKTHQHSRTHTLTHLL
jgi:transposase